MLASLVTRTPRQTELTAISRSTPDTTVTATPTVTDREHDGWGGGGWWVGIKAGVYTSGTTIESQIFTVGTQSNTHTRARTHAHTQSPWSITHKQNLLVPTPQ